MNILIIKAPKETYIPTIQCASPCNKQIITLYIYEQNLCLKLPRISSRRFFILTYHMFGGTYHFHYKFINVGVKFWGVNYDFCANFINKNSFWAKLPKSGKLEKSKNNYNFLKLVPNVVNFFLNVVKFDVGLGNNYCKIAPSFIFFLKNILCF